MPRFNVHLSGSIVVDLEVKAENEDEAKEIALKIINNRTSAPDFPGEVWRWSDYGFRVKNIERY